MAVLKKPYDQRRFKLNEAGGKWPFIKFVHILEDNWGKEGGKEAKFQIKK